MQQTTKPQQTPPSEPLFLTAAIEIGDLLIEQAVTDDRFIYWQVINYTEKTISYDRDDIYSGGSGIGLFFLELYKHTRQKKYLRVARRVIRTAALREKQKNPYPSFIVGRIGVAYALAKLYEATGTPLYRTRALALIKSCRNIYGVQHEYLGGNAGTVLGLLHIYNIFQEPWVLQMVNDYMQRIVQGIRHDTTGIYWDRNVYEVRPLCGFSHGVAGIGFVLLEVGRYCDNPSYYQIADQAFAYENAFFDKSKKNWPDFRLSMWRPEQIAAMERAYAEGKLQIFSKTGNMAAWCHGAPGIALSRIRAHQLTGSRTYLQDIDRAIETTEYTQLHDNSLCHGLAGNLDTFIESYLTLGRDKDWKLAHTFGEQLLQRWKQTPSRLQKGKTAEKLLDPSLFLGLAGVGYTFLRLCDPHMTPSILAPRLALAAPLAETVTAKLSTLRIDGARVEAVLSETTSADASGTRQFKQKLIARYPSSGLLFIKYRVGREAAHRLMQLTDDQLIKQILVFNTDCSMFISSSTETPQIALFKYTPSALEQQTISQFCYMVLAAFEKPRKVEDVIEALSQHYGLQQSEKRALLQSKILEQIRQAVQAQFLRRN